MKGFGRSGLVALFAVLVSIAGIGLVQPWLARSAKQAKRDDVFFMPPPSQVRAMTLGYRSAAADLIWAKMIVEHGLRWEERRPFPELTSYIDAVIALDPDFVTMYAFVDSLILYRPEGATEEDARTARRYLEQGAKSHPYNADVWRHYGEFVAFLSPSYLKNQQEVEQWRKEGALALARAVELGADPDRALSATSILTKSGERKAAIKYLQRTYAITDDPETRRQIALKLQKLEAVVETEATVDVVESEWRTRYPFLSRGTTLLLGPSRDPAKCAGPKSLSLKGCPRDWSAATLDAR